MDSLYLPQNGLNIDRSSLPQVKSTDVSDYLHWLKIHKHISSTPAVLPVASLHPSQGNFNRSKIHAFMTKKRKELRKPVIVSSDHYIVDGHHRWLALLNMDEHDTIPAIVLNAKINDVLAATHEYPKSFTKNVVESFAVHTAPAPNIAVLAYGRMNPPTVGHARLVDTVRKISEDLGAHHEIVLSASQDHEDNPLSQDQRMQYASLFFPGTNFVAATEGLPSLLYHAARLYHEGYTHLVVVAGEDRVQDFSAILHKYNGVYDEQGNGYDFADIDVVSSGVRDPNAEGIEGMSSKKMRLHASQGNFDAFSKGVPSTMNAEHVRNLYQDVRQGQGVHEAVEILSEGVHDAAIFKAVFITGAPGSGKDFVMKKALQGHGLTEVDSDNALEHLMDKNKLDMKMPEHEQEKRNAIRDKAKSLTELRQRLALQGRNGLIINSTGAKSETIKKTKKMLEELGYDTKMVFVDTSDNVSRNRNVERGQRGGRMIPEKLRAEKWRQAQDSRVEFAKLFGSEHYHEFNNDEDLRSQADPEVAGQKQKELDGLFKTVRKFTQQPPKAPQASEWIYKNLGKLAKKPVGNKKQQASQIAPPKDSQAAEEAKKLGLQYYGYGRYGKNSHITHFSVNGRLVEKQKALKPPVAPQAAKPATPTQKPKQLDEAFEELLSEGASTEKLSFQGFRERLSEVAVYAQTLGTTQGDEEQGSPIGLGQGKEEINPVDGKATRQPTQKLPFKKLPGKPRGEPV